MLFERITLLDRDGTALPGRYVGVRGAFIDYIGTEMPESDYGERYDGANRLLVSGFFNAHGHSAMTLLRGYGENMALFDWLHNRIFPFEAKMTEQDVYNGALLAFAEMLRGGTVSVTDMYFSIEKTAEAARDAGVKCNLSPGTTCFDGRDLAGLKDHAIYQHFLRDWHGKEDGRIRLDLSVHAEYTTTPRVVTDIAALAQETGLITHLHLSETKGEHEDCKRRHGKTPARYFEDLGVFAGPVVAAHCVHLEEEDLELLAARPVTVASCPASNMKLSSGFADIPRMLQKGILVALGTDGASSNNGLDMLGDMRLACILQKGAFGDPTLLPARDAIRMATRTAARALGFEDCGLLTAGMQADMILLDGEAENMIPCPDADAAIVYAAQGLNVRMTMVRGQILYRDGAFTGIDVERVRAQANEAAKALGVI